MLQDEIGSIMKYCYDKNPVEVYLDRIPQDMVIPCMYFPIPIVSSSGDTFSSYRNSYQLFVKVFAKKTQQAHTRAHAIAEGIRKARFMIPIISQVGVVTGSFMRLSTDIQTKELEEDVAQLSIKWNSRYPYDREVYQTMNKFYITTALKGGVT